jgi:nucleoside-diphosphate-sugar epimerase
VNRLYKGTNARLLLLTSKKDIQKKSDHTWISSALEDLTPGIWQEYGVEQIDYVFHLGAFIPKSVVDANRVDEIYRSNLIGTRSLLESLPNVPLRFLLASTIDVYGPILGARIDEVSPLGPASLYGASKLFCEQLVKVHALKYGFPFAILRYGHIFGPGEATYSKLTPLLIRRLLNGEAPVLYGTGSAERDFLYVEDAVEATIRAALSTTNELGPLNIVRGESSTIRDIAAILCTLTGFGGDIQYLTDKHDGDSLQFNNVKMKKLLGEWNLVSLEEGLEQEVAQFRGVNK